MGDGREPGFQAGRFGGFATSRFIGRRSGTQSRRRPFSPGDDAGWRCAARSPAGPRKAAPPGEVEPAGNAPPRRPRPDDTLFPQREAQVNKLAAPQAAEDFAAAEPGELPE